LVHYTTIIHIPTGIYAISGELTFKEKIKKHTCGVIFSRWKVSITRKVGTDINYDWIASRLNGGGHRYAAAGVIRRNEVRKQLLS
jgi:nanoRNase/pAp phosphatase (c-di-AMP/oligoRNAs hydrolase)